MVGWFHKVSNSAWHRISSLNAQESFELSVIVLLHGYLRTALRDEFFTPFEKLCDPRAPDSLLRGSFGPLLRETQKLWPVDRELKERLIDELELGFLTSSIGKKIGAIRIEIFNAEAMIEGIGCLALAEINSRLGRDKPTVLSETGYSEDPDKCMVQVILSWMRLTGLQSARFASMLSMLFFENQWRTLCSGFLDGFSIGVNRSDRETIRARAGQDCAQLSAMGTAIISDLADRIERRRPTR